MVDPLTADPIPIQTSVALSISEPLKLKLNLNIIRVKHTWELLDPDRWELEVDPKDLKGDTLEQLWKLAPMTKATLSVNEGGDLKGLGGFSLQLASITTHSSATVLTATRLNLEELWQPGPSAYEGSLTSILEKMAGWLIVHPDVKSALTPVWVYYGTALTAGAFFGRLLHYLAGEWGICLGLGLQKGSGDALAAYLLPCRHPQPLKPDNRRASDRRLTRGGEPFDNRAPQEIVEEEWGQVNEKDPWKGLSEGDRLLYYTSDANYLLVYDELTWHHPKGNPDQPHRVSYKRRWRPIGRPFAAKDEWSASGWAALGTIRGESTGEAGEGPCYLVHFPAEPQGDRKPAAEPPLRSFDMVCRLATPYGGTSEENVGLHLPLDKDAQVYVATPSMFQRPVILGQVRTKAVNGKKCGLYLPTKRATPLEPNERELTFTAAKLQVKADSNFDPPG